MAKILLISRKTIQEYKDKLEPFLSLVPVQMAVACAPDDAEEARKLTDAVAQFQGNTAIVADFLGDLVINEDGSVEPLPLLAEAPAEAPLVTEA